MVRLSTYNTSMLPIRVDSSTRCHVRTRRRWEPVARPPDTEGDTRTTAGPTRSAPQAIVSRETGILGHGRIGGPTLRRDVRPMPSRGLRGKRHRRPGTRRLAPPPSRSRPATGRRGGMVALRGCGGAGEGPGRLTLNVAGAQWTGGSSPRVAVSEAPGHSGSPSLFTEIDPGVGLHHRCCPQRLSTYQQLAVMGIGARRSRIPSDTGLCIHWRAQLADVVGRGLV